MNIYVLVASQIFLRAGLPGDCCRCENAVLCVMFKQWRIQANILLRNVSSLVCGFMKKNELAKLRKISDKTSFFVSIKQLPVSQSPRSPDLTTCGNGLWSYFEENLSIIRMDPVEQLKREIMRIFRTITPEMLRRASRRTWRHIQLCAENDGAHTKTLDVYQRH